MLREGATVSQAGRSLSSVGSLGVRRSVSVGDKIRALVVVLAIVAGLLMAVGSRNARHFGGQAVFVAGWSLALLSGLVLVQNY